MIARVVVLGVAVAMVDFDSRGHHALLEAVLAERITGQLGSPHLLPGPAVTPT